MTTTLLAPDGVPVTAKQERQARAAMYGGSPSRPLGGRSGFRPGTPLDTLTATSTTWTLKPCAAMIDPGASTHQGMYGWVTDANITGGINAADATNPRKDIVYVQVNDDTAGDGTGEVTYAPKYLAGPTDGSNLPPDLPPRSFLVGTISVPKATTGSPTVILNTARFAAAGGVLPVFSASERNGLDKFDGLTVRRMDLAGRPTETYDGAAWNPPVALPVAYSFIDNQPNYDFQGTANVTLLTDGRKRVEVDMTMVRLNSNNSVSSTRQDMGVVLPAAAIGSGNSKVVAAPFSVGTGLVYVQIRPSTGVLSFWSQSAITWAQNDFVSLNFAYYI